MGDGGVYFSIIVFNFIFDCYPPSDFFLDDPFLDVFSRSVKLLTSLIIHVEA